MLTPEERALVRQMALQQILDVPVLEIWRRNAWLPVPMFDYLFLKQLGIEPEG